MLELNDIHNYYEKMYVGTKFCPIIGNHNTRMAVSLMYPLRNISIVLRGEAGSAKTTIIRGLVTLVWGSSALDNEVSDVLVVSGTSDKGLLSDDVVEQICNTATHCIIPELENIVNKPMNEDIVKAWTEGAKFTYRRAQMIGKESQTKDIVLKPLPVLTSLANENQRLRELGEEMERRLMPFYTQSDAELNRLVHTRKAEIEAFPDEELFVPGSNKIAELREHFTKVRAMDFDGMGGPKIKNPSAPYLATRIPARFTVSNTYIGYWHEIVKAVTSFYYPERMAIPMGSGEAFLATPGDNFLAWTVGGEAVVNASLRLRDLGRVLMDVVPVLETGYDSLAISAEAMPLSDLVTELSARGYERSRGQIKELLMRLVMANYVQCDDRDRYWKMKDYSGEMHTGVDWKSCVESTKELIKEKYPKVAKDYIAAFCDDPVVIHPFTGVKVRVLDSNVSDLRLESAKKKKKIDITKLGV